ncbi:MAG: type II secretion system F family protein, partial [Armatimonadota bacterium]
LSDAMMEFPRMFPPHVVGTISAAELGGFLPAVLGDVAFNYELSERASSKWLRLAIHLGCINAVGTLIISPLVPTMLTPGVEDYHGWIVAYLHFTVSRIVLPIAVLMVGYHLLAAIFRHPAMRGLRDALILKLPIYGSSSRCQSLAMFLRILWRLQSSGILPIQAWEAASRAAENSVIASHLGAQVHAIRGGARFSTAMAATGYFSADEIRVLTASELSGQTIDALARLCAEFEDAAKTCASRAKWWAIRPVLIANIIAMAYAYYCISVKSILNQLSWVDWFLKME